MAEKRTLADEIEAIECGCVSGECPRCVQLAKVTNWARALEAERDRLRGLLSFCLCDHPQCGEDGFDCPVCATFETLRSAPDPTATDTNTEES